MVGEFGSRKTAVGRAIIRLHQPAIGKIRFRSQNIFNLTAALFVPFRRYIQLVFQYPFATLNPRKTVAAIIGKAQAVPHVSLSYLIGSAFPLMPAARYHTSFPAANANASASPARWPSTYSYRGEIPSAINLPSGCVFRTRRSQAVAKCVATLPTLLPKAPAHYAACPYN
ncbi:peptide ABC superfamily ATP binding cassette transporter, ABC protein [Ketogulonicigenium robustum]|uniref:Peptide ABC superfamily ATP binding cassette transporter, ABC protein n=1 Tax=Ketogulonicigenium robustum TaxID=92947 RepID=A0A1W6NZK3_9RHOB|nr:hypothetical protein [Ketogulonicigenium robustum]ARO14601.1 peptide ABC superfamily ATP binding cassette transporter, ABC protein [Ketogulonicigenium robustum]